MVVPLGRRRAELDPGPRHLGAVEVHPPAAADDRRALFRIETGDGSQPDDGRVTGRDGAVRLPDLQGRGGPCAGLGAFTACASQSKPDSPAIVAGLDLDQSDVEAGIFLRVEPQGAGHVDRPDRGVGVARRR